MSMIIDGYGNYIDTDFIDTVICPLCGDEYVIDDILYSDNDEVISCNPCDEN